MNKPAQTVAKVFSYNEAADTFNVEVNGVNKDVPASDFVEAYDAMQANIAADYSQPQQAEEYCLAMIYEMHFNEEPSDMCYTFYQVAH